MKRLLSIILSLLIIFSVVSSAMVITKAEETKPTSETSCDTTADLVEDSGIGSLISNAIKEENPNNEDCISNQILEVEISGNIATVKLNNLNDCKIIVALYDEETQKMLANGMADAKANCEYANVEINIETMPEYFLTKVFMLDKNNRPLCESLECVTYTRAHQEFLNKKPEDFDSEKVILFEEETTSDDENGTDEDKNFAVLKDETKVIKNKNTEKNKLDDQNDENKSYVFSNIDENITSLNKDDIFCFYHGKEYIIVKVESITIDGTKATIVGQKDVKLDEVFDFMRVNETSNGDNGKVDKVQEGVTDLGQESDKVAQRTHGLSRKYLGKTEYETSTSYSFKIDKKFNKDTIESSATLNVKLGASLTVELYDDYFSVEFELGPEFTATVTLEGTCQPVSIPVATISIPIGATGASAEVGINFVVEARASISASLKISNTIGFGYNTKDGFKNLSTPAKAESSLNFKGTLFIGLELAPGVEFLECAKLSFVGTVGVEFVRKGNISKNSDGEEHSCISGEANLVFALAIKLDIDLIICNVTKEYKFASSLSHAFNWCYASDHGFIIGSCPGVECKVRFFIRNSKGERIPEVTIDDEITDSKGYLRRYYSPGIYSVTVSKEGYRTRTYDFEVKDSMKNLAITLYKPSEKPADIDSIYGKKNVVSHGKCGEKAYYTLYKSGLLEITGSGDMRDYSVTDIYHDYRPWGDERDSIKKISINNGITSIGNFAFSYCDSLTSVTIGNGVTSIGNFAFYDCESLTSITIPDSVKHMGDYAFSDCSSLTIIKIPESVTSIDRYAFSDCSSLTSVTIPDSVTNIGEDAFSYCDSLTSVTIGNGVTSIGEDAFYDCVSLEKVNITDIKAWCEIKFRDSYSIPWYYANPLYYANELYLNNELITDLVIPNGVRGIGRGAFYNCTSLTSVTIPDSVTSIGGEAFFECESLKKVNITNIKSWCEVRFADAYSNPLYYAKNLYLNNELITDLFIPDRVTDIAGSAFINCTSLTSVTIPDSVTSIGHAAFGYCTSLTSITIPDSIIDIDDYAFYHCYSLTSVTIPDSVKHMGEYVFAYCDSLESIEIPGSIAIIEKCAFRDCTSLTSVTIPKGVYEIGVRAFYYCDSLTSVSIGDSVTSIGEEAFCGCYSLTDVYYSGTEEKWNEIDIGDDNRGLEFATIHFNSTGIPNKKLSKTKVLSQSNADVLEETEITDDNTQTPLENNNIKTLERVGLVPNKVYVLLVLSSDEDEYNFDGNSLLYITDALADENGKVTFKYYLAEETDYAVAIVFGECNHELMEWETFVVGDCPGGFYMAQCCSKCGNVINEKSLPGAEHDYELIESESPTCEDPGFETYKCIVCDYEKTEEIDKLGHTEASFEGKEPTCSEFGYTSGIYCSVCEEVLEGIEEIPKLSHKQIVVKKKSATYFATGYTGDKVCSVCEEVIAKGKTISKLKLKTPKLSLKGAKKKFTVKYTKVKDATGFEVRYKLGKGKYKTVKVNTKKSMSKVIKKLKKGKYTVQIRAFIKQGSKNAYSNWSKTKTVKVK